MNSRPLAAPGRRLLASGQAARYNGSVQQRARIIEALQAAGPRGIVGPELARLVNAPCHTKRISELRGLGFSISTRAAVIAGADGTVNTVALYVLETGPVAQGDLFEPP
jgi:Helix-turn-helix domain